MVPPMSAVAHHAKSANMLRQMSSCFFLRCNVCAFLWLDRRKLELCKRVLDLFRAIENLFEVGLLAGSDVFGGSTILTVEVFPASSGPDVGFVVVAALGVAASCDASSASG